MTADPRSLVKARVGRLRVLKKIVKRAPQKRYRQMKLFHYFPQLIHFGIYRLFTDSWPIQTYKQTRLTKFFKLVRLRKKVRGQVGYMPVKITISEWHVVPT